MELMDTVQGMCSPDYKERFLAEYQQVDIRCRKLEDMIVKAEAGVLGFVPTCPVDILRGQLTAMQRYRHYLRVRAVIERIDLTHKPLHDDILAGCIMQSMADAKGGGGDA